MNHGPPQLFQHQNLESNYLGADTIGLTNITSTTGSGSRGG